MLDTKVMEQLKTAMDFRHTSITALAIDMSVSKASVSDWLKTGKIAFEHLARLSLLLNISLDWLLLGQGKMELHGPIHPSRAERELITLLHQNGGSQALNSLHHFINSLLQSQLSNAPMQQILDYKMLEDMHCPLCVINTQGIVCDANDACLTMLGLETTKKTRFVSNNISKWIRQKYLLQAIDRLKIVTEDGVKSSMYCELIKADSTQQFIPVTIVAKTRQYHGETLIDCLFLQE